MFFIIESIIDFPQGDLDNSVWDCVGEKYIIKKNVKDKILDLLGKYPSLDLLDICDKIHIVGSICTNQYTDDADIDVHVIPKSLTYSEDQVKSIIKWYKEYAEELGAFVGTHRIEVYLQLNESQDYLSDGCYDLLENKWEVGPTIVPLDYNPYDDFSRVFDDVRNSVENADELFGELRRDVIDFDTIKDALTRLPRDAQENLRDTLKNKLSEIEKNIEDLYDIKGEWSDARKNASKPNSPEEAKKDIELAQSWKNTNAVFKFINRYKYMKIIDELALLLDDGEITADEISAIKQIMRGNNV